MSPEGIYLIEVAEWFGYWCSTIEQVGNRTGTGRVFVLVLDVRHRKVNKVDDLGRGRPEVPLFSSYYTDVLRRVLLLSQDCSILPLILTL